MINFGLLQNGQNAFYNALAMGQQAGQAAAGFLEARQEKQRRNALADVLTGGMQPQGGSPMGGPAESVLGNGPNGTAGYGQQDNSEAMRVLAERDPDTFMRIQAQQQAQEAARRQEQASQGVTMRQLLQHAGNGPDAAQQALAAAQQMGVDVSTVPPIGSPEFESWRQQQLFIAEALETPQGREELTAAAQEIMYSLPPEQRDVNNPAFIQAMRQHLASGRMKTLSYQAGGGVVGYDSGTGSITPIVQPGGQADIPPPPPGFTLETGGTGGNVGGGFPGR
jgi:hypothetical protein